MQSTRVTRSSVLGKRAHQQADAASPVACQKQLQTPDPTPKLKRFRTSRNIVDGEANKENVPPFGLDVARTEFSTPRTTRTLRRSTTELITPTHRTRPATKRNASMSMVTSPVTPVKEILHLEISTPPPTPPVSLLPLHARARALLRDTCNNTNTRIAGRHSERATIKAFLTTFLEATCQQPVSGNTSLYISGSPGTGKTALVNSIIHELPSNVKVVFVNCMALNNLDSLWERLTDELGNSRKHVRSKKPQGRDAVEALLAHQQDKCIIVLDELDHIASTSQSLSVLFSLPNNIPSSLRLIGIANTHTLTSSTSASGSLATHVFTLHFAPYTPSQLLQILQSRLQPFYDSDDSEAPKMGSARAFLPLPALTLLTKKIAALTGDVRSLCEVLRGAIDMAVTSPSASLDLTSSASEDISSKKLTTSVTPTHVLAALKAYKPPNTSIIPFKPAATEQAAQLSANSETVLKIKALGLQARLVLLSMLLASKRLESNLSVSSVMASPSTPKKTTSPIKRSASLPTPLDAGVSIEPTQLHSYYSSILSRSDGGVFEAVSRSEFTDLLNVLEVSGLVSLGGASNANAGAGARRAFGRAASFSGGFGTGKKANVRLTTGVRSDEVLRGLGIAVSNLDIIEEEVKAVWERENARLVRDLKNIEREKEKAKITANGLEGAQED